MAITASTYTKGRLALLQGQMNLASDALKIMLLTSSYTAALDTDSVYADISANEVAGTGYTAGGQALTSLSVTQIAANSWGANWAASTAYNLGQVVKPVSGNGFLYKCSVAGTSGGGVAPTAGTNASPSVLTATAHGLSTGNQITLSGITGNTNLNVTAATVLVLTGNTYELYTTSTLTLINGNGTFGGSPAILPAWPTTIGATFTDGTVTWTNVGSAAVRFTAANPSWATATITARYAVVYNPSSVSVANRLLTFHDLGSNITSTAGTFAITFDAQGGIMLEFGL